MIPQTKVKPVIDKDEEDQKEMEFEEEVTENPILELITEEQLVERKRKL